MGNNSKIDFYNLAKSKIVALKSTTGFEVYDYKIKKGITASKIEKLEKIMGFEIPDEMKNFYCSMNGCMLNWAYEDDKIELNGFWDIWPLEWVFFGWEGNVSLTNFKNPFEDILWNDYYEEKEIAELKKHKVLEPIEGEDSHVTCKLGDGEIELFYVEDGKCKLLPIKLLNYFHLIIESLGVGEIRSQIKKPKFVENPLVFKDLKNLDKLIKVDSSVLSLKRT